MSVPNKDGKDDIETAKKLLGSNAGVVVWSVHRPDPSNYVDPEVAEAKCILDLLCFCLVKPKEEIRQFRDQLSIMYVVTDRGIVIFADTDGDIQARFRWKNVRDICPFEETKLVRIKYHLPNSQEEKEALWSMQNPEQFAVDCQKMRQVVDSRERHDMQT